MIKTVAQKLLASYRDPVPFRIESGETEIAKGGICFGDSHPILDSFDPDVFGREAKIGARDAIAVRSKYTVGSAEKIWEIKVHRWLLDNVAFCSLWVCAGSSIVYFSEPVTSSLSKGALFGSLGPALLVALGAAWGMLKQRRWATFIWAAAVGIISVAATAFLIEFALAAPRNNPIWFWTGSMLLVVVFVLNRTFEAVMSQRAIDSGETTRMRSLDTV